MTHLDNSMVNEETKQEMEDYLKNRLNYNSLIYDCFLGQGIGFSNALDLKNPYIPYSDVEYSRFPRILIIRPGESIQYNEGTVEYISSTPLYKENGRFEKNITVSYPKSLEENQQRIIRVFMEIFKQYNILTIRYQGLMKSCKKIQKELEKQKIKWVI